MQLHLVLGICIQLLSKGGNVMAAGTATMTLDIDWSPSRAAIVAQAIPTFANVVSPSMDRTSPIHDRVFGRVNKLGPS